MPYQSCRLYLGQPVRVLYSIRGDVSSILLNGGIAHIYSKIYGIMRNTFYEELCNDCIYVLQLQVYHQDTSTHPDCIAYTCMSLTLP